LLTASAKTEENTSVLVLGYGNPARMDDGLGPALIETLERMDLPGVTVEADYQLTIEDAATVANFNVVIFADADLSGREPFHFWKIEPKEDANLSSHSVSPEAVLQLAKSCFGATPAAYILGIRGYEFNDFGERLSEKALSNLAASATFMEAVIRKGNFDEAVTGEQRPIPKP